MMKNKKGIIYVRESTKDQDWEAQLIECRNYAAKLGIVVDISPFTVDFYKTHIELFGKKEDLEAFRDRYGIKWELWFEPYRKSWHLAFNGCLAEYIRSKKANDFFQKKRKN